VSERVAWSEARLSVERLAGWLGAREGGLTVLTGVPNARVAQELAALDALTRSDAPATVGALREVARAAARGAVDPEALCAAAEAAGFTPSLGWSADPGRFDVTLQRRGRTPSDRPSRPGAVSADRASRPRGVSLERPIPADRPSTRRLAEIAAGEQSRADTEWATMANDPSRPTRSEDLARSLRAHLRGELPDAMIPAAFVELDALPRTPAGKLDTAALAALDVGPVRRDGPAMPPSDALEQLLVEIWEDVLRVDGIGVSDDFTELGGDSLLAVDVVARLEKALRGKVSLASVFGTHRLTIAKQAAVVRAQEKAGVDRVSVVALQPGGARPPIFFADTPLNLARHFPPHRPLYDVNIPVVHGRSYDLDRIEPTVAECVNAIRRVDPRGPYYLGGACFAGMLMLETAQRLHESGLEVARLVLIDPDPEEPAPLAARIVRQLRDLTQLPPGQRSEFLRAKRGSIARTARRIAHGRPEHEVKYDSLYEARWGAAEWTHPFPMTLMFTRPRYAPRRDSFAEWKKREGRDLTVQRLPGDRTTVFTEEHIRAVADAIAQSLLPR
jgi:thioesterase domain-containing protein/acyl carrier protein